MPPESYPECTDVDYDVPTQANQVYDLYLNQYDQAEREAFKAQAESEMLTRMQELFGTQSWEVLIAGWILNPIQTSIMLDQLDPNYGFSHVGLMLLNLPTGNQEDYLNQEVIKYYVREAQARCRGAGGNAPIEEWLNPLEWYEDSRLDYFTPLFFAEWFIDNL